jgi:hypothetical protein
MGVLILFFGEPVHKGREMFLDFFSIEDSINHMAAEESHLDLISGVGVDFFVFVYDLENIGSCGAVGELEVIKGLFSDGQFVPLVEVFNRNFVNDGRGFIVGVLKQNLCFHDFLIQLVDFFFILNSFGALGPLALSHTDLVETLRHVAIH